MHCTMDIGVVLCVVIVHGVDDDSRFLRRCGIIEIDESMAIDLTLQYWKVILYGHAITELVGIQDVPSIEFALHHVHAQSRDL